jgi:HAD superfamily hydrolase (TIGR01548 family)
MRLPKLIVFDMDGVLIDVSRSYRETVRKTARLFFKGASGFENIPDPFFPLSDLARLKQTGGLNNDWDLTAQAIHLLFALLKAPDNHTLPDDSSCHEEKIQGYDVSGLADFLKISPSPLMDLWNRYGNRRAPFVMECCRGDVNTGNVIKRIFQEIYLGPSLFTAIYGIESKFHREEGLIHHESLLMDKAILEDLADKHILAIATGRPQAEADYPLDHFAIRQYFQQVITHDDCVREEERILKERGKRIPLQKPNPFMLDLLPRLIGQPFQGCYYLGDMPDDMKTARSSQTGFRGVGVVLCSPDPEDLSKELLRAGADYVIDDYAALQELIG